MLPPRQQPRSGVLHTSLSLVPADGSNSDQIRDSPTESASSRETWPTADALMLSKQQQLEREKAKERENGSAEHSVVRRISNSDKMSLRDISKERVDVIAERMHHLPDDFLDKLKNELRGLIEGMGGHQHREEYLSLQKAVLNRPDLTEKTLVLAHRGQLEILVAIKTGIQAFLHPTVSLSQASLIEIFLYKSKFDFEVNTCRWIGCDLCSHWTHTDCAIQNAQIGMGPPVNGGSSGEMLFRCRACMRTSELFGWVKDVFHHCAPLWDREALVRELEYVSRIFRGSEESRGRKLYWKCGELVEKLKSGIAEPLASKAILSFFQEFDIDPIKHQEGGEGRLMAPQEAFNRIADVVQEAIKKMEMVEEEKIRNTKKARLALEACDQELKDKAHEVAALKMERQKKKTTS
ncbi:hypothetical protein QVD17_30621 [Tagetes erecta]|uniref:Oberon-like PHD finger domain-containing protein n=1 Tax=Tagetes erecta TaxID=13708 RepID=A0AAD8K1V1_TARER|nr:hypothetical protein QVD17_30621 [Tagetes erecta]